MAKLSRGDRVRVSGPMDDPDPIPVGTEGTVRAIFNEGGEYEQYDIDWQTDHPRRLMLLPTDPFDVI